LKGENIVRRLTFVIGAFLVFFSLNAYAQPKTRPWSDEFEKLITFVGEWKTDRIVYPEERAPIEIKGGKVAFEWTMDKTWLLYETLDSGVLQGHGLFTWDNEKGSYNFFWFDNIITRPSEYAGNWLDSQTLLLNGKMHIREKETFGRIKWQFISEDEINVVHEASADDKVYRVVSKATYYRVK
jgi:hypothetical protein